MSLVRFDPSIVDVTVKQAFIGSKFVGCPLILS